nr:hypothetical protein [uncultured Pseudomonas sp.]
MHKRVLFFFAGIRRDNPFKQTNELLLGVLSDAAFLNNYLSFL